MSVSVQELRNHYGKAVAHAESKVLGRLDTHCQRFIESSPFVVMATHDGDGHMDASPRGGAPGFVEIVDEYTLQLPDRPGNTRLDSLENLCNHGSIGLLFFLPGLNETLRVNGCAKIIFDNELCERYSVAGHAALAVIEISVTEAFMHGSKSMIRSRLWDSDLHVDRTKFPSLGEILVDQIDGLDENETTALLKSANSYDLY